jgi:phosphatidylglycerophosphatase A
MQKINRVINTVFGIGYLPIMPGTYASLAGVAVYLLVRNNIYLYIGIISAVTIMGLISCRRAEEIFKKPDPSQVVIDELSGILLAYLFVPYSVSNIIIGFFLFRILDIIKPYPINIVEKIKDPSAIMLDDIAAGIMTNIALHLITYLRSLL